MPRIGQPRTVAGRPDAAELEQADDPRALAAIRLQELEHPRVRAARLAGQRERDEVRQVEVADAHRVHVTERPDADLRRRPRTDARHGRESPVAVGERHVGDGLEPGRSGGDRRG